MVTSGSTNVAEDDAENTMCVLEQVRQTNAVKGTSENNCPEVCFPTIIHTTW